MRGIKPSRNNDSKELLRAPNPASPDHIDWYAKRWRAAMIDPA
jgi:hypothetical protein